MPLRALSVVLALASAAANEKEWREWKTCVRSTIFKFCHGDYSSGRHAISGFPALTVSAFLLVFLVLRPVLSWLEA